MLISRLRVGAGYVRRLRASCAMALALVIGGATGAEGPARAAETHPPLAYHATVVNGSITGSSFQIADGIAVTNAHVLGQAGPGAEVLLVIGHGRTPLRARARVLAVSARMDLALLSVPAGLLPVVPSENAPLRPGHDLRAAGVVAEASGAGRRLELPGRITSVSLTIQPFGPGLIAAMPGIRRGFSGGPVIDREGRLVGMIAALRPDPRTTRSATGEPLAGQEAFVLTAPELRAEVANLLATARRR